MSNPPRLRDVAARAGVSASLVSSFLNTPDKVGKINGARIADAIEELRFVPNDAARQLRRGGSQMVAFIAYDIAGAHFPRIARAAQARAAEAGLHVVLADTSGQGGTERAYISMFEEQRVRGVLLSPAQHPEEYLTSLKTRRIPAVLVDHRPPSGGWSSVGFDNYMGGQLAAKHLLDEGCRHVCVVGGDDTIPQAVERYRGASEIVESVPGARISSAHTTTLDTAAGRLAAQKLYASDDPPDAVLCINDSIAIGLLQELKSLGIRIPEDVSVVGYNNTAREIAGITDLSSIDQPYEAFGSAAIELLLEELSDEHTEPSRQIVFSPSLIVRHSSQSAPYRL